MLACPWGTLGSTQVDNPFLQGWFPVVGALGVSFLTVTLAGLIVLALMQRQHTMRCALVGVSLFLASALLARLEWTQPLGKPITVSLLQGNTALHDKFDPRRLTELLSSYHSLALASSGALIVFPETALPMFQRHIPRALERDLQTHARALGADILLSHLDSSHEANGGYHAVARSLGASGEQSYRKRRLVPFGEFVPFAGLLRPLYERIANVSLLDTSPGPAHQAPLFLAGTRVALRMCSEELFGSWARTELAEAGFIIGLVNDSWDENDGPMLQHLQFARARALEAAKPVVRAANSGVTAFIDHHGAVLQRLPAHISGKLESTVQPRQGTTLYGIAGDSIVLSGSALALLTALLLALRKKAARVSALQAVQDSAPLRASRRSLRGQALPLGLFFVSCQLGGAVLHVQQRTAGH